MTSPQPSTSPASKSKPNSKATNSSHGRALAEILKGCWRQTPLPTSIGAAQLDELLASLAGSGAGALAWRCLKSSAVAHSPAATLLQKQHLKQALDAKLEEREIARVFEVLGRRGIEALLIKGWATARLYPEIGARSVGDIDLLIQPADIAATQDALGVQVDDETNSLWDIKSQVPALYQVGAAELFARRERVPVGEVEVSVLGAEDHLRILCLHFLKHGAWRPLWLCDIAAALEFRPAAFDWDLCMGQNPRLADCIACTLGLAHQLLGANIENTPIQARAARLPGWLVPAVLHQWQTPQTSQHQPEPLLMESLRERDGVWQAVKKRWPNPIGAAMEWQTPLSWPPLLAQTATFVAGSVHFLKRAPRSLRQS